MADFYSPYTAFQYDPLAFQLDAFQIFGVNQGYAEVSLTEIRPVYASVVADEVAPIQAIVSIIEIAPIYAKVASDETFLTLSRVSIIEIEA